MNLIAWQRCLESSVVENVAYDWRDIDIISLFFQPFFKFTAFF